jgi:RNA polymerase sigma factor (TIGR02999 family)
MEGSENVTRLLAQWGGGDRESLDRLLPVVYDELRRLARSYLRRERQDHTLQPTALVNEAFFRLVDQENVSWQNRSHFFGIAAQAMRRILVDYARQHQASKRGAGAERVALDDALASIGPPDVDIMALDQALDRLARFDERQSKVVELRVFGGLSIDETAALLQVSPATVKRDYEFAKAWLRRRMTGNGNPPDGEGASTP